MQIPQHKSSSQHSDDASAFSSRRPDWVAAVAAAACGGLPAGAGWGCGLAIGLKPVAAERDVSAPKRSAKGVPGAAGRGDLVVNA